MLEKLQLYIARSRQGYKSLLNINPDDDVSRHVDDMRHALSTVDYDSATAQVFHLVSYKESGTFVTVIRTDSDGLPGDHIAATIYYPAGIKLTGSDYLAADRLVTEAIDTDEPALPHGAVPGLREFFSRSYPVDEQAALRLPSTGRTFAYAYYNGPGLPSFEEFARAGFYNPVYSACEGVLLVDARSGVKGAPGATDLTSSEIPETAVLLPPHTSREGFVPHICRHPFRKPVLVPVGRETAIHWKRPGFEGLVQKFIVKGGSPAMVKAPDTSQAHKSISKSSFCITEQGTSNCIDDVFITVNGIEIDSAHSFTYDELINAKVEITSPGYFSFSGNLDLASTTQVLVQMRQMHRIYRFDLPLHTPDPSEAIRIYLKSKKPIEESPVEGYEVAGGKIAAGSGATNNLVFIGGRSRTVKMYLIVAAVAGLLIGFLTGALIFGLKSHSEGAAVDVVNPAPATEAMAPADDAPPAVEEKPAEEVSAGSVAEAAPLPAAETPKAATKADQTAAVAYLDSHKVWSKADMEANPAMAGLFQDLDNYNFDAVRTTWAPKLKDSKNFAAVVRAVEGSKGKRNPRTGAHQPVYDQKSDGVINWRAYTYWVDP